MPANWAARLPPSLTGNSSGSGSNARCSPPAPAQSAVAAAEMSEGEDGGRSARLRTFAEKLDDGDKK